VFGHSNFKAFRIAFVLAAVAVWVVGSRLNGGEVADAGKAPSLAFGLPMQWAGVLVSVAGFILTFM
jgi:hypothetical protein